MPLPCNIAIQERVHIQVILKCADCGGELAMGRMAVDSCRSDSPTELHIEPCKTCIEEAEQEGRDEAMEYDSWLEEDD